MDYDFTYLPTNIDEAEKQETINTRNKIQNNALSQLRGHYPYFDTINLKLLVQGYILDPDNVVDIKTVKAMWVFYRNTDPYARSFSPPPPMAFAKDFFNNNSLIYRRYKQVFDRLISLDEGIIIFRSTTDVYNNLSIVKNMNKFTIISGQLEQSQETINYINEVKQIALNNFNYHGHLVIYNFFEIVSVEDMLEDLRL